MTMGSASEFQM